VGQFYLLLPREHNHTGISTALSLNKRIYGVNINSGVSTATCASFMTALRLGWPPLVIQCNEKHQYSFLSFVCH